MQTTNLKIEVISIHNQLDVLKGRTPTHTRFSKEIDHLLTRIAAIEHHLGIAHKIAA